jgi:hypothetical protein
VSKSGDDGGSSGRRKTGPHSLQTPYPCSELRPPAHVVYAADAAEYNAMLTSANSALHNSKHPERLRFHLIYPAETGPAPLCRVVEQYTKRFPGVKCVRPHGTTLSYSCKAGQSDAHGACHCATAQFRLVPFAASRYEVLEHTKANWLDRKELLMGVNFARNFLDDLLLPAGTCCRMLPLHPTRGGLVVYSPRHRSGVDGYDSTQTAVSNARRSLRRPVMFSTYTSQRCEGPRETHRSSLPKHLSP